MWWRYSRAWIFTELEKSYRGSESASYYLAILLGLLIYGYATRVFSSRALERATNDSGAFRFFSGNGHPDRDTIAQFRRLFLKHIEPLFTEMLKVARNVGMLKKGAVALYGTKMHANASRHSALSCGHPEATFFSHFQDLTSPLSRCGVSECHFLVHGSCRERKRLHSI